MEKKRFCAHRGVSALMPENTLPAFGAALALGANEIEFDIRLTKDGKLVVCHDPVLERISDGIGRVEEHTLEELKALRRSQPLTESCCTMLLYNLGYDINFVESGINNIKIVRDEDVAAFGAQVKER